MTTASGKLWILLEGNEAPPKEFRPWCMHHGTTSSHGKVIASLIDWYAIFLAGTMLRMPEAHRSPLIVCNPRHFSQHQEMFLIFQLHRHGGLELLLVAEIIQGSIDLMSRSLMRGIPFGDVAIQSAMKLIYNIVPPADITAKNEDWTHLIWRCRVHVKLNPLPYITPIHCQVSWMPSRAQMEAFAARWGPFGSIASLYMLRVADNVNAIFLRLGA